MSNQHSRRRTLFHFLFFSFKVPNIYIYPCWVDISKSQNQFGIISIRGDPLNLHQWSGFGKQLPRCRTSVIWRESALTSLDVAEEASPGGERGREGERAEGLLRGVGLQEKVRGLVQLWDGRVTDTSKHTADMSKHTVRRYIAELTEVYEVSGGHEFLFVFLR